MGSRSATELLPLSGELSSSSTWELVSAYLKQLLAEAGTRVLETVVVSVGGSNEEGLTPRTVVDATGQLDAPLDTEAVPNPNPRSTRTGTRTGECQDRASVLPSGARL